MQTLLKRTSAIVLVIFLTITAFGLPSRADQPFMKAALANLKQAQNFLKRATADKGGHRAKAMGLTAEAITAVNQGMAWDRSHPGSANTNEGLENNVLASDQPNMVEARNQLQAALDSLNKAEPNKGGYREQAIGLVQDAIKEVNAGIEYDRNH